MVEITKGYTFGSTELVTNSKLHSLVNDATLNIASLPSTAGAMLPRNLFSIVTVATNASIFSLVKGTSFRLHWSTYGTIASFTNMYPGQRFTLFAQQASFPSLVDIGNFKLNGNWIPQKVDDNITLEWNGSSFVEVFRTLT